MHFLSDFAYWHFLGNQFKDAGIMGNSYEFDSIFFRHEVLFLPLSKFNKYSGIILGVAEHPNYGVNKSDWFIKK